MSQSSNSYRPRRGDASKPAASLQASTRHARLFQIHDRHANPAPDGLPDICLLPGPTATDMALSERLVHALLTSAPERPGGAIHAIRWARMWPQTGTGRFRPLQKNAATLVQTLTETRGPIALVAVGSAALLLMRQPCAAEPHVPWTHLHSVTFFHPTLTVQNRRPRLGRPDLPEAISLIAPYDAHLTGKDQDARTIARRLAVNEPTLFLEENDGWFARCRYASTPEGIQEPEETEFAGHWALSWRAWLTEASQDQTR